MNQLEKHRIQEIIDLHNEIGGYLKMSLEKAIRIGELLTEQKGNLKHGGWLAWIDANLSFTDRTARNYMRLYKERDRLKTETVSDLKSAYLLIFDSEALKVAKFDSELKRLRKEFTELKALEKETVISEDPDIDKSLEATADIITRALKLQNQAAELHVRIQREMGKSLEELEILSPGIDWMGIVQDDASYQQSQGAINERIQQLS